MSDGIFKYEDCLLKHHVRTDGWLPLCRDRKKRINSGQKPKNYRRLRYFTFCAVGAIDVLMLDVAKVITQSQQKTFDTVFFFDRDSQLVVETQKRIPGAVGFVGDFIETILAGDLGNPHLGAESTDNLDGGYANFEDPLSPEMQQPDTAATRDLQRRRAERGLFVKEFPFDVINLDLEEFLFKPRDPMPGKIINALRRVFAWQRKLLTLPNGQQQGIDGFSLMFTTQVGPPNMSPDYLAMLQAELEANLKDDATLQPLFLIKTGTDNVQHARKNNFDAFFKLAMPKVFANVLMEEDWYFDPESGLKVYEFERTSASGPYTMLHLVADVRRQVPPRERRAPGKTSPTAQQAYREVVREVFSNPEIRVTEDGVDSEALKRSLEKIRARRRKYCPDE